VCSSQKRELKDTEKSEGEDHAVVPGYSN
jgi:hypothetical protein